MKSCRPYRIVFLCAVLMLALAGPSWADHDGDLDGDGRVTIADALRTLRIAVQLISPTDNDLHHADVSPVVKGMATPDLAITIADALQILRKAVGLTNWATTSIPFSGNLGSMTILKDGKKGYVAHRSANLVAVIDTDPQSPAYTTVLAAIPVDFSPAGLALTPDNTRLYVTGGVSISVIATTSDQVMATIPLLNVQTTPGGIAITPDGKRAYFTSYLGRINLLDTDPASPTYNQNIASILRGVPGYGNIAISPDGTKAVVHWSDSNEVPPYIAHSVDVLDIDPLSATYNQIIATPVASTPVPDVPGLVAHVAIAPNGKVAFATDQSNRLCKIDLQSNTVLNYLFSPYIDGGSITLSPDGLTLYHSNFNSPRLMLFRTADLSLLQEMDFGANLGPYLMVTPDVTRAYVQRTVGTQNSELLVIPLQAERTISATGIIKQSGITTYMYGSHIITDTATNTVYALTSSDFRLDDFVGLPVTVTGHVIASYPLDGGPQYLNVYAIVK